jgi:uncharacterized protein YndB with AHSA1/START domain
MTVIDQTKDVADLTLTFVAQFDAAPERVWELWENPRQLEKWWGPPTYPATFVRHEFVVGGESRYFMTGPAGDKAPGWWRIESIDKPNRLEFANGIAGDDGEPRSDIKPMAASATFEPYEGGTRMTVVSRFIDTEQMEKLIGMGMEEGMGQALGQIDALLL